VLALVATAGAQPLDCLDGTVDVGRSGTPATVLAINGSVGDTNHVRTVGTGELIAIYMSVAPSGPDPASYALYVWVGEPSGETVSPQPRNLGDMCFPTPLTGGVPHPRRIWNNIGKFPQLGNPDFPSGPAPGVVFVKPLGVPQELSATFQGFLLDNGSAAEVPASVTNGVILRVKEYPTPGDMVLLPEGEFQMGCHSETGETCNSDELPVHAVYLSPFWMDTYEVTTQQYVDALNWAWGETELIDVAENGVVHMYGATSIPYCDTTIASSSSRITWDGSAFGVVAGKNDHPVVEVSWYGAAAYSNWRSAMEGRTPSYDTTTWACNFDADGYRLPTEAEWEYAARGGNHDPYTKYPWGDAVDGSMANFRDSGDPFEEETVETTPVGYYNGGQTPAGSDMENGYGLYDMGGNLWEWCNDWYFWTYYGSSPYVNPRGPESGLDRVLRGGSWLNVADGMRCAIRNQSPPVFRLSSVGFRLVLD